VALNTALMNDVGNLVIAEGAEIAAPIHVIHIGGGEPGPIAHPRTLVTVGAGARVQLVESFVGLGASDAIINPVTEIACGERSTVRHHRVLRDGPSTWHIGALGVRQETGSDYRAVSAILGGRLVRTEMLVTLAGENARNEMNGVYHSRGEQLIDNHTRVDHAVPNCESHQLFKGVLDDRSRGVFDGKILVRKNAQKTDAYQTSRNLLLSDDAISNNKPQLEIYADDVKCSHGATTGQIASEQVFYLMARGLSEPAARSVLTYAFAREIVEDIEVEAVRNEVDRELMARLPGSEIVAETL